jgi:High potential iron-sulfur protein
MQEKQLNQRRLDLGAQTHAPYIAIAPHHKETVMTHDASNTNRRRFIKLTVAGVAAVPVAKALFGGTATAVETVSEASPQAQALGYKMDAKKAANRKDPKAFCDNCNFYSGKAGAPNGPCQLFTGNLVSAKGWCTGWIKKQA